MERRWEPQGEKQEEFVVSVQQQLRQLQCAGRSHQSNRPFTVTLKYFEGDSTRFEERLLYAKDQAEAERAALGNIFQGCGDPAQRSIAEEDQ